MKTPITFLFLLLTMTGIGQLNNGDAFFRGDYDKAYIQKHKIKQVTVNAYLNGRHSTKLVFDFDNRGFLIKETTLDSSDKKANDFTFTYNTHGDQIERNQTSYSLNKTYSTTFEKTYNGSQLVTEMSSNLPYETKHSYNEKGQKIRSVTKLGNDSNANNKDLRYAYDKKGRLISCEETLIFGNGGPSKKIGLTKYQYDTYGNIIKIIRIDLSNEDSQMNYELKYIKNGLLIKSSAKMPEDLGGLIMVDNYSYVFWK